MKTIIISVLLILMSLLIPCNLLDAVAYAEEATARPSLSPDEELKNINAPTDRESNDLYIDLAREIERSERDRRIQGNTQLAEEGVSLLQGQIKERQAELEDLQKNLQQLDSLQTKINDDIKNRIENNPNIKLLVTLYESLSSDQAAELIKRLPMTVSLKMVQMMNPKKFSKILASMDPKFASELSRRLIREPALAAANTTGGK
ncbi:MAG: hypothetical protein ACD_73C00593G0006 [uncultured bacterium]|nr:MAG: hypothetical protein ACD_73C00593G0006 [uncultured bacterium]